MYLKTIVAITKILTSLIIKNINLQRKDQLQSSINLMTSQSEVMKKSFLTGPAPNFQHSPSVKTYKKVVKKVKAFFLDRII